MTTDEITAFAEAMDLCWLDGRFDDLRHFMTPDVVVSVPDAERVDGIEAVIATYRDFRARCAVTHFRSHDHVAILQADSAVIEYRWEMTWREAGDEIEARGREILALHRSEDRPVGGWRVFWRTQLPA